MRVNTVFEYPHSGSLVKYTLSQDPNTGNLTREYYTVGPIRFKLIPGRASGGRPVMYTDVKLNSFDRIVDIRDSGDSTLGGDAEFGYEVQMVVPVMNPFGFLDGYSYSMTRLNGNSLDPAAVGN